MILKAQIPKKLGFLFQPARYKVARGGRGSAKSWSFARALLVKGVSEQTRILCAREVQLSIKQSVHKLLKDQIKLLNLEAFYTVLESEIRGSNGTEFAFTGLSTLTIDTIKSFEGYDICWVEEGQTISRQSWKILIPTIRKMSSEIWISYNPDLETDPTHEQFTINPPPDTVNALINWRDNPFFNDVLERERQHCKIAYPDDYPNIWEGECRPAVEGAIYFKEIQLAEQEGRICNVPHDTALNVHLVMDLGWEDSLGIALVQRHTSEVRVIEYVEVSHTDLPSISADLRERPYRWGRVWLPHDGFSGALNTGGKSTYDIMSGLEWDVTQRNEIVELSVEEGIRNARIVFKRMYFDKDKCAAKEPPESKFKEVYHTDLSHRLLECVKRYRRHINRQTGATAAPVKDPNAHGADTLRYIAANVEQMTNDIAGRIAQPKRKRPRLAA